MILEVDPEDPRAVEAVGDYGAELFNNNPDATVWMARSL